MKDARQTTAHDPRDIERVISLFFAVRGVMRTRLAQGKRLDPSAWLRLETLKFIRDRAEPPMMKDIADHLSITAPSATSLVCGLAKSGWVERTRDARDHRSSRLALTRSGRAYLARTFTRGQALLAALFAPLSPADLAVFTRALERIRDSG